MQKQTKAVITYALDRFSEQSTWQGIGFVVALLGSKYGAGLDWGQAAGLGGAISATLKMVLADK